MSEPLIRPAPENADQPDMDDRRSAVNAITGAEKTRILET